MKKFVYTILIIGYLSFLAKIDLGFAAQKKGTKTNLDLLECILDSTLDVLHQNSIIKTQNTILIKIVADDSSFISFQKSYLQDRLLNLQQASIYNNVDDPVPELKITYRWIDWQIGYLLKQRMFWRKTIFQRNLQADLFVEVVSLPEEKVRFSKRFSFIQEDRINKEKLKEIQNVRYPFTQGEVKIEKSAFRKWIEPIFLFAISGTVIYLFYSIRS